MKRIIQYINEALISKNTIIHKFNYLTLNDFVKKYKLRKNRAQPIHRQFYNIGYDVNKDIINMFEKLENLDNSILDESINYIMPKFNLRENWKLLYDYYDNYLEFHLDPVSTTYGNPLGIFQITKNSWNNNIDSEIIYYWKDENLGYRQHLTSEDIEEIEKAIFTWIDYLLS